MKAQPQTKTQEHLAPQRDAHQRQKARRAKMRRNQDDADEEKRQQHQETQLSSGHPCGQTSTQS
jgi:hypothetical protein